MSSSDLRGRPRNSPLNRREQIAAAQRSFRDRQRQKDFARIEITLPRKLVDAINQKVTGTGDTKTRSDVVTPPLSTYFLGRQPQLDRK